jgi:hypothetical protein
MPWKDSPPFNGGLMGFYGGLIGSKKITIWL